VTEVVVWVCVSGVTTGAFVSGNAEYMCKVYESFMVELIVFHMRCIPNMR